jgi:hypothetical protein
MMQSAKNAKGREKLRLRFAACAVSMWGAACAPFPSTTAVAPSSHGVVQDALTRKPMAGVRVTAERARAKSSAHTSKDGFFTLPAITQWHYLIYIGSPGVAPVPWHFRGDASAPYIVTASASGYESASQSFDADKIGKFPNGLHSPGSINFLLKRNSQ